jgi:hypothetical protein
MEGGESISIRHPPHQSRGHYTFFQAAVWLTASPNSWKFCSAEKQYGGRFFPSAFSTALSDCLTPWFARFCYNRFQTEKYYFHPANMMLTSTAARDTYGLI